MAEHDTKRKEIDDEWAQKKHEVSMQILDECLVFLKLDNEIVSSIAGISKSMDNLAKRDAEKFMDYVTKTINDSPISNEEKVFVAKSQSRTNFWDWLLDIIKDDKKLLLELITKLFGI